jgi:hypothetical protein
MGAGSSDIVIKGRFQSYRCRRNIRRNTTKLAPASDSSSSAKLFSSVAERRRRHRTVILGCNQHTTILC